MIANRLLDRPRVIRRAVLLASDQRRGVLPTVCVKSGATTETAVRVRAADLPHGPLFVTLFGQAATVAIARVLRRPVAVCALPVAPPSWRLWRGRLIIAVVLCSIGAALIIAGVARGVAAPVVVGALLFAGGWLNRVRASNNAWVGVEWRSARGEFVVSRVHSTFDIEAAALYSRAVLRRSQSS